MVSNINSMSLVVVLLAALAPVANSLEPQYFSIDDYNLDDFSSDTWAIQYIEFEEDYDPILPSLAFFEGKPSFSFTNASQVEYSLDPVIYAELEGTAWCTDTVFYGEHRSDLQILQDGTPCLATSPTQNLAAATWMTYITRTAEGWTHADLYDYTNQHVCSNIKLAFDESGNPHILADLWNGSGAWIIYAHFDGADWVIKDDFLPHGMPSMSISTAFVIDNEDNPHLFYHDKHSFFQSDYWWIEILDMDHPQTAVLDTSGYLHVIHGNLEHIYDAGPAWLNETITSGGDGASSCIGADGNIHVAFQGINCDLFYAYRDSSGWSVSQIDWVGLVGYQPSIALDDIGNPCILYRDHTNDCLKLAWFGYEQTGIETHQGTSPSIINLLETWPNPSYGSALVVFDISTPAEIDLNVFEISGRLIRSESLGLLPAGQHSAELFDLTPGVYTITLSAGVSVKAYRVIVL